MSDDTRSTGTGIPTGLPDNSGGYRSPVMPTPPDEREKTRREDLRATLAAAAFAIRIQQGAGNTTSGGKRREYAATEAVADADALIAALGR
jgi:hypothetical protein